MTNNKEEANLIKIECRTHQEFYFIPKSRFKEIIKILVKKFKCKHLIITIGDIEFEYEKKKIIQADEEI
jgi:hypothetical protein